MVKSSALHEKKYFLGTSIARLIVAKWIVKIAEKENADAISHGYTGKGNDQVRFENTAAALKPTLKVIAPWRIWDFTSRDIYGQQAYRLSRFCKKSIFLIVTATSGTSSRHSATFYFNSNNASSD